MAQNVTAIQQQPAPLTVAVATPKITPSGAVIAITIEQVANGYIVIPISAPSSASPPFANSSINTSRTVYATYALACAAGMALFGETTA